MSAFHAPSPLPLAGEGRVRAFFFFRLFFRLWSTEGRKTLIPTFSRKREKGQS
jgi:hypothetical protein